MADTAERKSHGGVEAIPHTGAKVVTFSAAYHPDLSRHDKLTGEVPSHLPASAIWQRFHEELGDAANDYYFIWRPDDGAVAAITKETTQLMSEVFHTDETDRNRNIELCMIRSFPLDAEEMAVMVRTLVGKRFKVPLKVAEATVAQLKQGISETENIPVGAQRIVFGGKQLADDALLKDCGVINGGEVFLVLRLD